MLAVVLTAATGDAVTVNVPPGDAVAGAVAVDWTGFFATGFFGFGFTGAAAGSGLPQLKKLDSGGASLTLPL